MELVACVFALAFFLTVTNNSHKNTRCDDTPKAERYEKKRGYKKTLKECTVSSQQYDESEY